MVGKFLLVLGLYVSTLIASMGITQHGGISNYNGYILLIYCFLFFLLIKNKKLYAETFGFSAAIVLASLGCSMVHVLIDCAYVFFLLSCLYIGHVWRLSPKEWKITTTVLRVIYFGTLLGMFLPFLYIDTSTAVRYGGLFHAINFSANIFGIIGIALWEVDKLHRRAGFKELLFLILTLILYMGACGTRSLLFFIPYWMYQLWMYLQTVKYRKLVLSVVCLVFVAAIHTLLMLLEAKLRFQEGESSMTTRATLYLVLIDEIKNSYFVLPNGVHSAHRLIVDFTQNDEFSPHNDWLSYLYDWGAIFLVFLYSMYRKLRFDINLEFLLILLGLSSVALHNMLFSMYVWIPFTIILLARNNEKTFGYSPEIQ